VLFLVLVWFVSRVLPSVLDMVCAGLTKIRHQTATFWGHLPGLFCSGQISVDRTAFLNTIPDIRKLLRLGKSPVPAPRLISLAALPADPARQILAGALGRAARFHGGEWEPNQGESSTSSHGT
jgi:hypothetical protein